jgi:ribosome biogenesis protein NSA1
MRICDFHATSDGKNFAYGGDEVELSLWDVERAFAPKDVSSAPTSEVKKRKKPSSAELLPGEIWQAKNVSAYIVVPYLPKV